MTFKKIKLWISLEVRKQNFTNYDLLIADIDEPLTLLQCLMSCVLVSKEFPRYIYTVYSHWYECTQSIKGP